MGPNYTSMLIIEGERRRNRRGDRGEHKTEFNVRL